MNRRSHLWGALAVILLTLAPGAARADSVALLPLGGRAESDRLESIASTMTEILREQGHRIANARVAEVEHPPSRAALEEVATGANATYVVVGEVEPLRAQYRLHIHVYYRGSGRLEDLVVTVLESEERARLSDILSSMVRSEGLGEDALRLTGTEPEGDPDPPDTETEEERRQREAEEAARREAEERERREAEERERQEAEERERQEAEAQRTAAEAWNARVQYGADAPWLLQLGAGGGYAFNLGQLPAASLQGGGGLFMAGARVGRTFEGIDGFEVRAGIDFWSGAFTALGIHVGVAWLGSFFVEPIFIGPRRRRRRHLRAHRQPRSRILGPRQRPLRLAPHRSPLLRSLDPRARRRHPRLGRGDPRRLRPRRLPLLDHSAPRRPNHWNC